MAWEVLIARLCILLPGGFVILWRDYFPLLYYWWCRLFFLLADGNGPFLIAIISPSVSETPHSPEDLKVKCTCVGAVSAPLKCEFLQAGRQQLFRSPWQPGAGGCAVCWSWRQGLPGSVCTLLELQA